jgi:hypothetical protein
MTDKAFNVPKPLEEVSNDPKVEQDVPSRLVGGSAFC